MIFTLHHKLLKTTPCTHSTTSFTHVMQDHVSCVFSHVIQCHVSCSTLVALLKLPGSLWKQLSSLMLILCTQWYVNTSWSLAQITLSPSIIYQSTITHSSSIPKITSYLGNHLQVMHWGLNNKNHCPMMMSSHEVS